MKSEAILEKDFYHDGRGPELIKVMWDQKGIYPKGFQYFNPDDEYTGENLKFLELIGVKAFSLAGEDVHGYIIATIKSKAAIYKIRNSSWLMSFNSRHLSKCFHYQIMFYDEIYDVICQDMQIKKVINMDIFNHYDF